MENFMVFCTIIAVFSMMAAPGALVWLLVRNTKWFQRLFPPVEFDGEEW